jgi:hypothetical protein
MMRSTFRSLLLSAVLAIAPFAVGCVADDSVGSGSSDVTDVNHTDVERQSIGNCWLYAQASWVESMHLSATGVKFDISQSYWTYWHWYEQILEEGISEIETGGGFDIASDIVRKRGLITETKFIKEDAVGEMSSRQSSALTKINDELKNGRLKEMSARMDPALVRQVLDEAWALTSSVKGALTKAFGKDGQKTFLDTATTKGTSIIAPSTFEAQYTERLTNSKAPTVKKTTLDVAMNDWSEAYYPTYGSKLDSKRRDFQIRVQKALHDGAPVIITWDVDFNAMESTDATLRGSFNLTTLKKAGKAGRQGGHMTVLEDYQVDTKDFGTLAAGVTLDPNNPTDKAKLDAALLTTSTVKFFRVKNSWGAFRDDRSSAPGMPGYHDLYMDYMNGPIAWCPDVEGTKSSSNCTGTTAPFGSVHLPPGY